MIVNPTRRRLIGATLASLAATERSADAAAARASTLSAAASPVPMPPAPTQPLGTHVSVPVIPAGPPGLGQIAASRGRSYGAAIQSHLLAADPVYKAAVTAECGVFMPDYESKWGALQPKEGVFNFGPLDNLLAWARACGRPVRGHALVWHQDLPDWLTLVLAEGPKRAWTALETHITTVLGHTEGAIHDWDVVNEVVADPLGSDTPQAGPGELRDTPWLRALGPNYIGLALRFAKQRDRTVRVALNEYGVEEAAPHHYEKRRRLLSLVRDLRKANYPLDVVGVQGHLQMVQPFSGPPFTEFCRQLRAEGLQVVVTEMDVREHWRIPDGFAARDRLVADRVKAFMDAALDGGVQTFLTWGLEDKYSWLATNSYVKRHDGLEHRGLPLDDDGHRKPYWLAMADAFRRA
jgi:endo-1,4-beta-xylanase